MNINQDMFSFLKQYRGLPFRSMTVFNFLLEAALLGSVLILLVLLVRKTLRSKIGNRAVYMAWLLVAIRLLAPISLPNPMMNELKPTLSFDTEARPIADQIRVRAQDAMMDLSQVMHDAAYAGETPNEALAETANLAFNLSAFSSYGWLGKWLLIAYLAVAAVVFLYMGFQNIRFRNQLQKNRVSVMEGDQWKLYLALCRQRNVQPVPVYFVDPLPSACLVGVIRPYIALPLTLSEEELPQVLAHEICHLKGKDPWWTLLRNLCCVVHWFNPLVWIAARCARTDCELACDERVTAIMTDDERVAYAGTLVLASARRNAPHMSVLATGMTMTGKRLKQRVQAIVQNKKRLLWLAATFGVVLAVCTGCAFFTSTVPEQSYEQQMSNAARQFSLNGELAIRVPEGVSLEPQTITDETAALAYAENLLQTPYFTGMSDTPQKYGKLNVTSFEGEWRVDAPEMKNGFELYFDSNGKLLYWDECYPLASDTYPYEEELVKAPVEAYIRQFAKDCLGDPTITDVRINEQRYTLEERYVYGTAMDGTNGLFEFVLEPFSMRMVGFQDMKATAFGDGTLFGHSVHEMQNWLLSHTSAETQGVSAGTFRVEALDGNAICTTFTISASAASEEFRNELQDLYGRMESYVFQSITDRYGAQLPYKTKEAYLNRNKPVISQQWAEEAAVIAAAALFQTDPANVSCSTVDYYQQEGWYEAYCSYQPNEVKQLMVLRLDAYDAHVLSVETPIVESELNLSQEAVAAVPTPSAPVSTREPENKEASEPYALYVTLSENGSEYKVPLKLIEDTTGLNGSPTAADVALPEAAKTASEAVCKQYGLTFEDLSHYVISGQFSGYPENQGARKWWINFNLQSTGEYRYGVDVSATDGQVVDICGPGDGNG
ncbi:MAG: M56 family metallopeptidase [Clostridia bacterium]|nr:M56 family metallopeptidase [Clostridia bacterium]